MTRFEGIDRRTFLVGAGAAGGLVLLGCSDGDDEDATPATEQAAERTTTTALEPLPRPTLRLPGSALGFPTPFAAIAGLGYYQMSLIFDPLLWKDSTGEVMPWLAESFESSDDRLEHTFSLREARWHDGTPVTAEDVAFTFEYFGSQTLSSLVIAQPSNVAAVDVVDDRTARIVLERPAVTFLDFVAAAVPIIPKHVWASIDDAPAAQTTDLLVGSGPYRLESLDDSTGALAYEAYDEYMLGPPFVERLEFVPVGDQLTSLLAGDIAATGPELISVRPEALAPFTDDEDTFGVATQAGGFTFPLYWNIGRGGPLADVRFRRACALAIDRVDIVERLLAGNGEPGGPGFLPPSNPFHRDVEQYEFDPEASGRLLDEMGYTRVDDGIRTRDGEPLQFGLLFATDDAALAELVISSLMDVGIGITQHGVPLGPALFGPMLGGSFDLALTLYPGPGGVAPNGDPDLLRQIFSSRAPRTTASAVGYENETFDDLAARQLVATDVEERTDIVGRMQEILAEDVPVLPIYYATLQQVYRKDVLEGWYFTPGGFPVSTYNKQLFVTGRPTGREIRPTQ